MGAKKKLNAEDLKCVTGGTMEEGQAYMNTLLAKYNLAPDNYSGLLDVITHEEYEEIIRLIAHGTAWEE